ncbi:TPA: Tn3 family transposase [Raoultella ornithinolytica]|jgi:TnpA family transposase|nr:Tn3 family transposase [Raoultella ornithinolytica]HDT5912656.1 Tn3 family transposase [Raoultella ornithinolytica]HDT5918582.1 Tn3 family transposase [Raoultella ornithinolytica]HDT5968253.1 Tn3 family transposase [Raoultella ornithinolytica]HDT6013280.1 Tn3 family transposase [Raoultella ornithinolytica]
MANEPRRLSILSSHEIDELFGLPNFSDDDRRLYFDLSAKEREAVEDIRTFSVAAHLVLQLGYFKAKRQFFLYEQEISVLNDLRYIVTQHFPARTLSSLKSPSRPIRTEQQRSILQLFNYQLCDSEAKAALEDKAQRIAMLSTQPIYIFRELIQYLELHRIVMPSYRYMQEMIGRVVAYERTRIAQLLNTSMDPLIVQQLTALLQADSGLFRVSALKHEAKDFSYKELRQEVARRQFFQPLHEFAQQFLTTAGISNESGKYYASLVKFYTTYKLQRMKKETAQLYLLFFAFHRFRQINDNLIEALIHWVDQYEKQAKRAAEEAMNNAVASASKNLQAAGHVLSLFTDDQITDDTPFSSIKEKAFTLLDPEQFPLVSDYLRNIAFDKTAFEWSHYTKLSATFKRNLRQLFSDLDFAGRVEDSPLLEAIEFLQNLLRTDKSPRQTDPSLFPTEIIPKGLRRYLFRKEGNTLKDLDVDRYEFLVYRLLRNSLEAGDLYVKNSNEFRRFEDDLISDLRWQDKEQILREISAPILLAPIKDTLAEFHAMIEARYTAINQHITEGVNKHIKVIGAAEKRRWKLLYPSTDEPINSDFYSQLPGIGIADLLWFVAGNTGFLSAFTHVLDRYVKHEADPREIFACIVAMGTNMGLSKMAEVSGLSAPAMAGTSRNYLRLETLRAANDAISNATSQLPAFHLYDIQDTLHSSSDGQRMETQINTLNARYSPKYFGLQKGVSAYTLVANHVPINAKIIGTHEHESHYVFDLLHNNTSDIKPERHSTDTHGTNQVNFWILHAFGYYFAPRYRDLHKKMETLVGSKNPAEYGDWLIKPSRKTNDELIEREWPNIQRIMASLAQKDVTQATIVRKLSSYSRQNQTKKALWELENICRTLYILEFIDDVGLRQCVQKALNRGEAYHRLRRAVAFVNGGKFRVKTEEEQQIWNECSRLITNAVIYYNTVLLSRVYEQKQAVGDQNALTQLQGISPVAWQHINMYGSFEFSPSTSKIDIDALVARYADPEYWLQALTDSETSIE